MLVERIVKVSVAVGIFRVIENIFTAGDCEVKRPCSGCGNGTHLDIRNGQLVLCGVDVGNLAPEGKINGFAGLNDFLGEGVKIKLAALCRQTDNLYRMLL